MDQQSKFVQTEQVPTPAYYILKNIQGTKPNKEKATILRPISQAIPEKQFKQIQNFKVDSSFLDNNDDITTHSTEEKQQTLEYLPKTNSEQVMSESERIQYDLSQILLTQQKFQIHDFIRQCNEEIRKQYSKNFSQTLSNKTKAIKKKQYYQKKSKEDYKPKVEFYLNHFIVLKNFKLETSYQEDGAQIIRIYQKRAQIWTVWMTIQKFQNILTFLKTNQTEYQEELLLGQGVTFNHKGDIKYEGNFVLNFKLDGEDLKNAEIFLQRRINK